MKQLKRFPGGVSVSEPRVSQAVVSVDGTYLDDPNVLFSKEDYAIRPLGYYVPAGELVDIEIDNAYTNLGLSILVGAHTKGMEYEIKPAINRFRSISCEFALDELSIQVSNPFGGGLYVKVPQHTSVDSIDINVSGAVKSAYFSTRLGHETDVNTWLSEVANSGVPWVDFESDKFMFTVPLEIAQDVEDPVALLGRWDEIMDQYRIMNGRPLNRMRAEYLLLDRMLPSSAFGAGYPLVTEIPSPAQPDWNPTKALTVKPNDTLFHEFGHNCAITTTATLFETRELASGGSVGPSSSRRRRECC